MSQNDGIMLSRYLSPEPPQPTVIDQQRLENIAQGRHPRPTYGEVCKMANELLARRVDNGS